MVVTGEDYAGGAVDGRGIVPRRIGRPAGHRERASSRRRPTARSAGGRNAFEHKLRRVCAAGIGDLQQVTEPLRPAIVALEQPVGMLLSKFRIDGVHRRVGLARRKPRRSRRGSPSEALVGEHVLLHCISALHGREVSWDELISLCCSGQRRRALERLCSRQPSGVG